MDKENLSDEQRKNIESILDQLKKALPLPPSKSFLKATENALEIFIERNYWHVLVTVESVFYNLMEFAKERGIVDEYKEMWRTQLFANLFLRDYQRQYLLFSESFIRERDNYTKQPQPNNSPVLEINSVAQTLFKESANLAVEIFGSKYIQGEHLILSFFSKRLPEVQNILLQFGIDKEKLLFQWVLSMRLSDKELDSWNFAFSYIECNIDLGKYVEERKREQRATRDEIHEITGEIEEQAKELESMNEQLENVADSLKEKMPGVDEVEEDAEEEAQEDSVSTLVISKEELGRATARADEPASKLGDDLLGRKDLVEALSEMIADENQGTPFTIGLLGRWGAGKSTVMKMLQDVLNPNNTDQKNKKFGDRFIFAEFNAWEYERTDNLEAGLAQEVVRSLVEPLGFREKLWLRYEFALREHGPKVLLFLFFGVIILAGFFGEIVWVLSNLGSEAEKEWWFEALFGGGLFFLSLKLWDHYKKVYEHPLSVELRTYLKLPNYGKHLGLIPVLKRHIKSLCQIRLGTTQERIEKRKEALKKWDWLSLDKNSENMGLSRRLVVFIDDLDRCDPASITKTLDAVRLVMDVEHVVVIIGIDHRIAFRAVGDHYKDLADGHHSKQAIARDYLGKILQLAIILNQPQKEELQAFVSEGLFPNVKENDSWEEDYVEGTTNKHEKIEETEEPQQEGGKKEVLKEENREEKLIEDLTQIDQQKDKEDTKKDDRQEKEPGEEAINLWHREIKFKKNERDLFSELAETFEFRNPRQLLRLRNSYGLLKLLYGMGKIPFNPFYDKTTSIEPQVALMILLFWKEFEANHPEHAAQVKKPPKNISPKPIVSVVASRMSEPDIGGLDFSFTGLTATAEFVERFVLPRGEDDESEVVKEVKKERDKSP